MERAVHAYARSERDAVARMAEAFGLVPAEAWPGASLRVRKKRNPKRLWSWALRRWGRETWPGFEYEIREAQVNQTHNNPDASKTP